MSVGVGVVRVELLRVCVVWEWVLWVLCVVGVCCVDVLLLLWRSDRSGLTEADRR
jgi:hypothetical protein